MFSPRNPGTLLAAALTLACSYPSAAGASGRSLSLLVYVVDEDFRVCTSISNEYRTDFYMTMNFGLQLEYSFTDAQGAPDVPVRTIIQSLQPAPPPESEPTSYFILEGMSRLETCRTFELSDFSVDEIHVRVTFRPWLRRNAVLPEHVQRMSIDNRMIRPPLYEDEFLVSNACVIDRHSRQARCDDAVVTD